MLTTVEIVLTTVEIAGLGHVRLRVTARCKRKASRNAQCRCAGCDRGQLHGAVTGDESEHQRSAGEDDRREKDRVEQDQEREQGSRCRPRPQARLSQRPQRESEPSCAGHRQQPRRRRACERDLSALSHAHPGCGASCDQRQQPNVAGQRHALEDQGDYRPARAHVEHSPHAVSQRMNAALREQQRGHGGERKQRRQGRSPRKRAKVQRRERDLGDGGVGCDGVVRREHGGMEVGSFCLRGTSTCEPVLRM